MSLFTEDQSVTLDTLVGEGKKFATADDLAKAKAESDRFIQQLQAENAELRKTVTTPDRTQEILDRLEALNRKPDPVTPPVVTPPAQRTENLDTRQLTEEDILRLMTQREQKAQATRNVETVKTQLKEKFGDSYPQVLKSLQEQMGVTQDFLNNIAATSPKAFLQLLPQGKSEGVFTPPPSNTTQQQFQPTGGKAKPLSHYNQLKAEDKAKYFSPAVQNQMYKDAMELKEAFYDV